MEITKECFDKFNLADNSYINLPEINYEDKCDQFRLNTKSYQIQYFPYYNARVNGMMQMVESKVKQHWGSGTKIFELNQLNDTTEDERVCLVGVTFKYSEKHPSILKEVSKDFEVSYQFINV